MKSTTYDKRFRFSVFGNSGGIKPGKKCSVFPFSLRETEKRNKTETEPFEGVDVMAVNHTEITPPIAPGETEEGDQILVVNWFKRKYGEMAAACLHHSPNGGKRGKLAAMRFRSMGVRRGFPDLALYMARHGYCGLAVELKLPGEEPTEDQFAWIARLRDAGWLADWADSIEEAQEIFEGYMGIIE